MAQASAARKQPDWHKLPEEGTVTVGCNVVNGLMLNVYGFDETKEPILNGGGATRDVKVAVALTDPVHIKGPRWSEKNQKRGPGNYGYVLTPGVDAAFMRKWMEQNENTPLVKNRCIIVHEKTASVKSEAKELEGTVSGLEPIIPGSDAKGRPNDPRIPRPLKTAIGSVGGITTDDENDATAGDQDED